MSAGLNKRSQRRETIIEILHSTTHSSFHSSSRAITAVVFPEGVCCLVTHRLTLKKYINVRCSLFFFSSSSFVFIQQSFSKTHIQIPLNAHCILYSLTSHTTNQQTLASPILCITTTLLYTNTHTLLLHIPSHIHLHFPLTPPTQQITREWTPSKQSLPTQHPQGSKRPPLASRA